jgi:16S rRNA (guanine1516-N2)-methyltransferase
VAGNARGTVPRAAVHALARWCDAEPWLRRPLPRDRPGIQLTGEGLRLLAPGLPPVAWHPGFTARRIDRGEEETLVRVLRLRPGESVLDATLGLGHDAVVLAAAGARVLAIERVAPILVYTAFGLRDAWPAPAAAITYRRADHQTLLPALAVGAVDHVFLDPMFPSKLVGASTILAPLRAIADGGRPSSALLAAARRVARRSVVLRLAAGEASPEGARVEGSKRVRYAVWRSTHTCATPCL